MSVIGYGVLTRLRTQAPADQSQTVEAPSMRVIVDGLAALVPGEILILHGAIVAWATVTTTTEEQGVEKVASTFDASSVHWFAFWILVAVCALLYVIARTRREGGSSWSGVDFVRMLLPAAAFAAWALLGKGTLADSTFGDMNGGLRLAIGGCLGVVVAAAAVALGKQADAADAKP
ncbi:hypothetical protein SAMN04489727_8255 [Amycolatopsis tolypomycina]|uniref:Uncharacterized protein n=1 Tax=Amycolatopsis tolypomycina TaxID=208445 RepID=A0A1H5BFY2_9PSEU|nr:hypothetical protein [Amycolatopsis tolypomycina]SED53237.1 hypothetical protein SAMN04489727_8255 [Amycolatopsis tolypomycina]